MSRGEESRREESRRQKNRQIWCKQIETEAQKKYYYGCRLEFAVSDEVRQKSGGKAAEREAEKHITGSSSLPRFSQQSTP